MTFDDFLDNQPKQSFDDFLDSQGKSSVWEDVKATASDLLGNLERVNPIGGQKPPKVYRDEQGNIVVEDQGFNTQEEQQEKIDKALSHDRPEYEQKELGFGGKFIHGAGRIAPALAMGPLGAGAWGAAMVHGDTQREKENLIKQGVPEDVVDPIMYSRYVSNAAQQFLPLAGKVAKSTAGVFGRSAVAGAANTGIGALEDEMTKRYLSGRGYEDVAQAYDAMDLEQRGVEFLLGAGPGTYRRYKYTKESLAQEQAKKQIRANLELGETIDPTVDKTVKNLDPKTGQVKQTVLIPSEFVDPTKPGSYMTVSADSELARKYNESLKGQQELPFSSEFRPDQDPTKSSTEIKFPKRGDQLDLFGPEHTKAVETAVRKENAEAARISEEMTLRAAKKREEMQVKQTQEQGEILRKVDQILQRVYGNVEQHITPSSLPALLRPQGKGESLTQTSDTYSRIFDPTIKPDDVQRTNPLTGEKLGAFKNKESAEASLFNRGLEGTHVTVPVNNGYIIRPVVPKTKLSKGKAPERKSQEPPKTDLGISGETRGQTLDPIAIAGEQRQALKKTVPVSSSPESVQKWLPIRDINEAKNLAKKDIDTWKLTQNTIGNINWMARDTGHPILRWLSGKVDDAVAKSREFTTRVGTPFAEAWQKLSDIEKAQVEEAMIYGKNKRKWLTPEELKNAGLTDNQIQFIQKWYDAAKQIRQATNEIRAKNEQPLVPEHPGYFPSNWFGDFTQIVFERKPRIGPEGIVYDLKIRDVIQVGTKQELKRAQEYYKNLYKDDPDVFFTKVTEESSKSGVSGIVDYAAGIRGVMNLIGDTPQLQPIKKMLEDLGATESSHMFGQHLHDLRAEGVGGYEGARPWRTPQENSKDFFNSLVSHLEEAAHVNAHSEYLPELKGLQGAQELQNQPNLQGYLSAYYNKQTGRDLTTAGEFFNQAINIVPKLLGIGPKETQKWLNGISNTLSVWMLSSVRHFITQILQPPITAGPILYSFNQDLQRNFPFLSSFFDLGTGYKYLLRHKGEDMTGKKKVTDPVWRAAFDYADANGITSFSGFDQIKERGKSLNQTRLEEAALVPQTQGEALSRPAVFYTAYNSAIKSGMPIPDALEAAKNVTTMGMFGYQQHQSALWEGKLGVAGQQAMRLKKFTHGLIGLQVYLGKHDKKAFASLIGSLALAGGITGTLPIEWVEEITGADITNTMLDNLPEWLVVGGMISKLFGVDLQPSLDVSDPLRIQKLDAWSIAQAAFPYPTAAANIGWEAAKLAIDPTYATFANALKASTPSQFKPSVDNIFNLDERNMLLSRDRKPRYKLSEEDIETRWYGLRSYKEGVESRKGIHNFKQEQKRDQKIKDAKEDLERMLRTKDFTVEHLQNTITDLYKLDPVNTERTIKSIFSGRSEIMRRLTPEEQLQFRNNMASFLKYQRLTRNRDVQQKSD